MNDAPKNGDFASYLEQLGSAPTAPALTPAATAPTAGANPSHREEGADTADNGPFDLTGTPSPETIENIIALMTPSDLSDAELERQALEAPGADGDPSTPE